MAALSALPVFEFEHFNSVAGSFNKAGLASRAVGVFGIVSGHIADIDIIQSFTSGALPGLLQGSDRSRGEALELVERIEATEMQRDIRAQFVSNPAGHGPDLLHVVVLAGHY